MSCQFLPFKRNYNVEVTPVQIKYTININKSSGNRPFYQKLPFCKQNMKILAFI